ncbi:MAG TPA: PKD domain-containing protein, partial [Thermoplasmatales archaeon]|nr:PKD domain-containing protein [Thermoplasmatales archaeon]
MIRYRYRENDYPKGTLDGDDEAKLPTWGLGYYWKYDMIFGFEHDVASMKNGHVKNMRAEVVDIKDGNYIIELTSDGIEGKLRIMDWVSATLKGDFSGSAILDVRTLGLKEFKFHISGKLGGRSLNVVFGMEIEEGLLNFLEFPLKKGKEWDISCKAKYTIKGNWGMFTFSHSDSGSFNDHMKCVDHKKKDDYDSFLVSGELGKPSEIWFSPEVGFLVSVNEKLPNWGGLTAIFKLNLLETNYIARENNPPDIPSISGPAKGDTGVEYTFTAKSTDPDGDKIKYIFDWGDLQTTETDYFESGKEVKVSHYWDYPGIYEVTVKAVDSLGGESLWSEPIYIDIGGEITRETRNVTITIYKIKGLDKIEGFDWKLKPDWSYKLYFYDGEKWLTRRYDCPSQYDPAIVNKKYKFQVVTGFPKIKIKVWDRDLPVKIPKYNVMIDYHDLADVSGHVGGGKDNNIEDDRGAIYCGIYSLGKHGIIDEINEENDFVKEKDGYYIASGEFPPDNSKDKDENDAEVWFKIVDDYNPKLRIVKPSTGDYFYTNETIEFEAELEGAIPPYKWTWYFDDGNISHARNPTHKYAQRGDYFVRVYVEDGTGYIIESDPIIIHVFSNTPPHTPDRPYGPSVARVGKEYTYSTSTLDPDVFPWTQKIQYGWDWDGDLEVDEWTGFYKSGERCEVKHVWETTGTMRVSVKARDELGAESDWSPPLTVAVPYVGEEAPPTAIAEVNKNKITRDDSIVTFISKKSHDNDENGKEIKWIRWDFDGDGEWDTGSRVTNYWIRFRGNERIIVDLSYLFNDNNGHVSSLASHQNSIGSKTYFARLEVKDDEGDTDIDYVQMTVVYSSYENKKPIAVAKVWPAKITRDHAILYFDSS